MDIFMDRLAQKRTAQEIIKANTAADVEELNRLKNQIAEYNECLEKLRKLIDDGFGRLSDMGAEEEAYSRMAAENLEGIKGLRQGTEECRVLIKQLQGQLEALSASVTDRMENLSASMEVLATSVTCQRESLSSSVGGKIDQLCGQLEAQSLGGLSERLDCLEENVHKECVKVYRNVQAVMVEESAKQGEALTGTKTEVASVKGRMGVLLGVSMAAMALSLAGVVFQVLSRLNLLPF